MIMPLLILLGALVVMYWGSQRDARKKAEIHQYVQQLCNDAADGRIIVDRFNNPNALVVAETTAAMKAAWAPSLIVSRELVVRTGDVPQIGDGSATHTAVLHVNNKDVLGLRIAHGTEGGPIEILGYWTP
jgi:hypothetical protein